MLSVISNYVICRYLFSCSGTDGGAAVGFQWPKLSFLQMLRIFAIIGNKTAENFLVMILKALGIN